MKPQNQIDELKKSKAKRRNEKGRTHLDCGGLIVLNQVGINDYDYCCDTCDKERIRVDEWENKTNKEDNKWIKSVRKQMNPSWLSLQIFVLKERYREYLRKRNMVKSQ